MNFSAYDRARNTDIFQFHWCDLIGVFVQYREIGALANLNAANLMIHFQRISRTQRDGVQRLVYGELDAFAYVTVAHHSHAQCLI